MIETIEKFLRAVQFKKQPEFSHEGNYIILKVENPDYDDGLSDNPYIVLSVRNEDI